MKRPRIGFACLLVFPPAGHRVARSPAGGRVAAETDTTQDDTDPVLLLLETLRKRGAITQQDFDTLKAAIAAKENKEKEKAKAADAWAAEQRRAEEARTTEKKKLEEAKTAGFKPGQLPVRVSYVRRAWS